MGVIPPDDEIFEESESDNKPGPVAVVILLLLILALITTLIWPVLWQSLVHYNVPPTPTPFFLQEI